MQLLYLHWPMDHDVSIYVVGAHEFLQGKPLYSELWLDRTPLVFATFGLAQWLFGYGLFHVFVLGAVAKVVTALGIFEAARSSGFGAIAGLWSVAFWLCASCGVQIGAESPNMEVFINAATVWAIVCLIRASHQSQGWCWTIGAGILFATASFYKHNVVVVPAVLSIGMLWGLPHVQPTMRVIKQILIMAGIGMLFWVGLLGYFALIGRWTDVYNVQIRWVLEWVGQTSYPKLYLLTPNAMARCLLAISCLIPAALLMIWGLGQGLFSNKNRHWWFVMLFLFANHLSIAVIGERWEHYFQLWFPPICIGAGWVYVQLMQHANDRFRPWAIRAICTLCLLITICMQYSSIQNAHRKIKTFRHKFNTNQSQLLGRSLATIMKPDDRVYHLGDEPGFMVTGYLRPSHGLLYHMALVNGFLKDDLTQMVIRQQKENPGRIAVITSEFVKKYGDHLALKCLDTDYVWVKKHQFSDMFLIFVNNHDPQRDQLIEKISQMQNPSLRLSSQTQ